MSRKNTLLIFFIFLLFVIFISLTSIANLFGNSHKLDMTDNARYSLSATSLDIIRELNEPVYIKIYLSSNLGKEKPAYSSYVQYVLRYLKKYQQISPDKIKTEIINPEPYSPQEEEALTAGMKPIPDSSGQSNLFFGAVFSTDEGQRFVIPNFIVGRRGYLETDISRILSKFENAKRPTIGLMSPRLPLINHQYGKIVPNWAIIAQLQNDYNVVEISEKIVQLPENIDALVVVNPAELPIWSSYALDQYVLRGGNLLIFADVLSEKQVELSDLNSAQSADWNKLFRNWGFELDYTSVIGNNAQGEMLLMSANNGNKVKNFPFWMQITEKQINQEHPLTAGLKNIRIKTAGALTVQNTSEKVRITPLFTTEEKAGKIPVADFKLREQAELASLFVPENEQYALALLAEGKFNALFSSDIWAETKMAQKMRPFIPIAVTSAKIIVVSDSDLIVAENWADASETINNPVYGLAPIFDNGNFILRAVDYLTGKNDLLGLRNKNTTAVKTAAQNIYADIFNSYALEYNQKQQELESRIATVRKIEKKLANKLSDLQGDVINIIEENRAEIKNIQKELKQLEYKVKQDNNNALNKVMRLNIITIPLIIMGLFVIISVGLRRHSFKKAKEMMNESSSD